MSDASRDSDQLVWFALYGVIYVSFYFFTSPFVGNPELLTTWTPYVYLSMGLYGWLFAAAALHTPVHQLGLLDSTIKHPISLLFPFFSVSFLILVVLELLMVPVLPRIMAALRMPWKTANITLARSFANVIRNSAAISVACVALILHCDPTEEIPTDHEDVQSYNQHACEKLFFFSNVAVPFVPGSYRGAVVIWIVGVMLAITNFVLERISGLQMISIHWLSQRGGVNASEESDGESENRREKLPPAHRMPMVPWYSMFLFDTAFQLLISLKVFLGRFDHRALQRALYPDEDDYLFDHLAGRDELWLDFMADCGDGFNSSYHIARLLAQPELQVECPKELLTAEAVLEDTVTDDGGAGTKKAPRLSRRAMKRRSFSLKQPTVQRSFPRGDTLVIGGDLAYPHPDSESYEHRLWRCFEYAMKPPREYDPCAISTGKLNLPKDCPSLADYKGPTVFAIPGNHDWFDGLNTFTRFVARRDWLGGWLLPQKTSHFCLKLPHNWWLLGVDLALENDINTEQFEVFQRLATKHMGENDSVIIVTHEPRWILDAYEQNERTEEKLSHLMNHVLKGRVVLRLAGDLHNYTRYSLHNTNQGNNGQQQTSPTSEKTSKSPADSPSKNDRAEARAEPLRRRRSSSLLRSLLPSEIHFPHMFDDDSVESAGTGHNHTCRNATSTNAQHLIVSGGGGAFLHPTHAPNMKTINLKGDEYEQRQCYPPVDVSRRYALLNVFGFRRINWRFDVVGGLGYFLLVFSMFPRCSVSTIYATSSWLEAAIHFVYEIQQVQYDMLSSSYVSFATFSGLLITVTTFADCTSFWKKCVTGVVTCCSHCLAAISILLVFECIFEVATERGSLGREGDHSLYRYFSESLPDFSDVTQYDVFNLTQLFAQFMQFCMTIFDVPEMVATHRIKICNSPAGHNDLSRLELWQYYFSVLPYFWVLATPIVSAVFGAYLYIAINVFGRHYNEAFSALRISSYKNFLRLHFHKNGDLELFAFGIDKMPRAWCRDSHWSGGRHVKEENQLPSYQWSRPSYWQPKVTKVGNIFRMDFENPELDTHFNTTDRSNVHLIDRVLIPAHKE